MAGGSPSGCTGGGKASCAVRVGLYAEMMKMT